MVTLVDYSRNINKFDPEQLATIIKHVFHQENPETFTLIKEYGYCFMNNAVITLDPEKNSKIFKDYLENLESQYYISGLPEEESNSSSGRKLIHILRDIEKSLTGDIVDKRNVMETLFRIYEWPYWSDQELAKANKNIALDISQGKLNLFDFEKCAYSGSLEDNIYKDFDRQESNVYKYCRDKGIHIITKSEIKRAMSKLLQIIDKGNDTSINSETFTGVINLLQECRYKLRKHENQIIRSMTDGVDPQYIMTKASGSLYNHIPSLKTFFQRAGSSSVTNVCGDFIHSVNSGYGIKDPENYINITADTKYYTIAYGKGDCYKLRVVGEPSTEDQNFCEQISSVLTSVCNRRDENGKQIYPFYATYSQEVYYRQIVKQSKDMFDLDFTGYSDYLNRNFLIWILDEVLNLNPIIVKKLKDIFDYPVIVNGQKYYILWGTLQGLKLDFILITIANIVMWFLGCLIANKADEAAFNGDDRIQGKDIYNYYDTKLIGIYLAVSIWMNCVTNYSKVRSWNKNGIVTFCKIKFDSEGRPISGLGANIWMKQKAFINDISALYQQLNKTGYLEYRNYVFSDDIDKLIYDPVIYDNLGPYSDKFDIDLDIKIKLAKTIPLEWGGLSDLDISKEPVLYLSLLDVTIRDYIDRDVEERDLSWLDKIITEGGIYLKDTPRGKYLMEKLFDNYDIIDCLRLIEEISTEWKSSNTLNMDKYNRAKELFRKITREAEWNNVNGNVSTKNRSRIRDNEDKLLTNYIRKIMSQESYIITDYSLKPKDLVGLILSLTIPFKEVLQQRVMNPNYTKGITFYEGFGHQAYLGYIPIAYRGLSRKHIVRLETKTDSRSSTRLYDFLSMNDLPEDETEFCNLILRLNEYDSSLLKGSLIKHSIAKEKALKASIHLIMSHASNGQDKFDYQYYNKLWEITNYNLSVLEKTKIF